MSAPSILIARHPRCRPWLYEEVIQWAVRNLRELMPTLTLRMLPARLDERDSTRLMVPWLQDPVQQRSESAYREALELQADCDERGIPVINRVERLTNATKSEGARRIASAGFRTARVVPIADIAEFRETLGGLQPPFYVREDWGHGPPMLRADTPAEARALDLRGITRPVVIEIIDVRSARDGLYRKFRYFAAGDIGVSHHLQVTADWISRGEKRVANETTQREELDYIAAPDPHHKRFQAALRALELDFAAFDYGYTSDGEVVVWEANPYPYIKFSTKGLTYRNRALHRTVAAMYKLYMTRAGLEIPAKLDQVLAYDDRA